MSLTPADDDENSHDQFSSSSAGVELTTQAGLAGVEPTTIADSFERDGAAVVRALASSGPERCAEALQGLSASELQRIWEGLGPVTQKALSDAGLGEAEVCADGAEGAIMTLHEQLRHHAVAGVCFYSG